MKIIILILSVSIAAFFGCKAKKEAGSTKPTTTVEQTQSPAVGNTAGKVSHQYRSTGCATVVIVKLDGQENPLTLIPKDKLAFEFDVDGLEITFNYHTLRMPQPAGCNVGLPAEITDIAKK